ncbi:MAG TPA: hypothetical protein VLJ86_09265 [Ramlibacter sp.]|nr:hypothetical protein [Ramlibacter sp.]
MKPRVRLTYGIDLMGRRRRQRHSNAKQSDVLERRHVSGHASARSFGRPEVAQVLATEGSQDALCKCGPTHFDPSSMITATSCFSLTVTQETGSPIAIKEVIMSGGLYGILPMHAMRREVEQGLMKAVRIVEPVLRQQTVINTSTFRPLTLASRSVLRLMPDIVRGASPRFALTAP